MSESDVQALLDLLICGMFFSGFFCGLIAPDFCKLINRAAKLLGKKLEKISDKKQKKDDKK